MNRTGSNEPLHYTCGGVLLQNLQLRPFMGKQEGWQVVGTTLGWGRRVLQAAYNQVQNHAWLKRAAVRIMMWFPALGKRVLANVGTPAHVRRDSTTVRPVDLQAQALYVQFGYRPLLGASPPPAAALQSQAVRQLLVDISGLVQRDAGTGIQRVVHNLTRALAELDLPGWRVEPVYVHRGRFCYARAYITNVWNLPVLGLPDAAVDVAASDVFFTPDLALLPIAEMRAPLEQLREQGVRTHFVLYDLIPVLHPEFYQGEVDPRFVRWLSTVLEVADSVQCISRAVEDDFTRWLAQQRRRPRARPLTTGWFHLGAAAIDEAGGNVQTRCVAQSEAVELPPWLAPGCRTFLMVGTLEPRKGHDQVLDAFEMLWADGVDVHLVIIGKVGWNVKPLIQRLHAHPQSGQRLHWLDAVSDAELHAAYRQCGALIAASYAEGFGLPLIEAAQYKLPIIARDIPVFREVAQHYAYYFDANNGPALAAALRHWIRLDELGAAPQSAGMPWLTWQQSAAMLARTIIDERADPISA